MDTAARIRDISRTSEYMQAHVARVLSDENISAAIREAVAEVGREQRGAAVDRKSFPREVKERAIEKLMAQIERI